MPIPATQFIWFNGKLVPWEKATVHVLAHALHYGSSVFEGRACLRDPAWRRDLPPARSHAPPLRIGQDLPHPHALLRRGGERRLPPGDCRQRFEARRLHPSGGVQGLRRDRCQPEERSADGCGRGGLGMGQVPRDARGGGSRRRCLHLIVASGRPQHPAGARQGGGQLPLEPADRPARRGGSASPRVSASPRMAP